MIKILKIIKNQFQYKDRKCLNFPECEIYCVKHAGRSSPWRPVSQLPKGLGTAQHNTTTTPTTPSDLQTFWEKQPE